MNTTQMKKNFIFLGLLMVAIPLVAKAFEATDNLPVDKIVQKSDYICDVHIDHKNISEDVLKNLKFVEMNISNLIPKQKIKCGRGHCDDQVNVDLEATLDLAGKKMYLKCYENF